MQDEVHTSPFTPIQPNAGSALTKPLSCGDKVYHKYIVANWTDCLAVFSLLHDDRKAKKNRRDCEKSKQVGTMEVGVVGVVAGV